MCFCDHKISKISSNFRSIEQVENNYYLRSMKKADKSNKSYLYLLYLLTSNQSVIRLVLLLIPEEVVL